jgi:hypothetical protein
MSRYTQDITNPRQWIKRALKRVENFKPDNRTQEKSMGKTLDLLRALDQKKTWTKEDELDVIVCSVRLWSDLKWDSQRKKK